MDRIRLSRLYIVIGLFFLGVAIIIWIVFSRVRRPDAPPVPVFPTITLLPTDRFTPPAVPTAVSGGLYPTYPPTPIPGPGTLIVSGIAVNNFSDIAPFNPQGDKILAETNEYQIVYIPKFQEFKLTIKGKDFEKSQKAAESVFLQKLGIDAFNACRLTAEENVPNFVKNAYAGQVFPLSFCEHEDEGNR